ncbi:hypothetical protein AAFP35_24310 [Gordonia sp. CPCC 206044]|uniref:hypothetical protein n=1 Tax=Gordonia sp. CPCC 206044 TaxID=3140793 RepID=UPI003AF3FED3
MNTLEEQWAEHTDPLDLHADHERIVDQAITAGTVSARYRRRWVAAFDRDPHGAAALLDNVTPVIQLDSWTL